MKINILPNLYLKNDGTFDKQKAFIQSGKIAGVCYNKEGYENLDQEPIEKTIKRIDRTLQSGHHSVYDHINISMYIEDIPKILAMVINNEKQYTTSEKSARYTPIESKDDGVITELEEQLYWKWVNIFKIKIKSQYGNLYSDFKINTLAQENARYLISVFMPTKMVYTTTIRQLNYLASWFQDYIKKFDNSNDYLENNLCKYMKEFIEELDRLNILEPDLMKNEKNRKISLFGENLSKIKDYYSNVYSTTYNISFAALAQAQRHRTLNYQLERTKEKEYFIPPIIEEDLMLKDEWLEDLDKVKNLVPSGEKVLINETGTYENFILKLKERLCSEAQLEIMLQTKETLNKYKQFLEQNNNPLKEDIVNYTHGARCTFPDYKCSKDCQNKEGKRLIRKI